MAPDAIPRALDPETKPRRSGRMLTLVLALPVPLILAAYVFIFPFRVLIERDLQLHGVMAEGRVIERKITYTKRRDPIYNYRVQYRAGNADRRAWITSGARPLRSDTVEVRYAPFFTRYAVNAAISQDPWDQTLVPRFLAALFISACGAGAALGIYRRFRSW